MFDCEGVSIMSSNENLNEMKYQMCSASPIKKSKSSVSNNLDVSEKVEYKQTDESSESSVTMLAVPETLKLNSDSAGGHEEAVFFIDHIIESIFARLDRSSLLHCRFVCHRWAFFGAKALQKIVCIKFRQPQTLAVVACQPAILCQLKNPHLSVAHLVSLLNNSKGISNEFPCTSFEFLDRDVLGDQAQFFFERCGHQVKKLVLSGDRDISSSASNPHTSMIFQDLANLLILCQLPNLEHLVLYGNLFKEPLVEDPAPTPNSTNPCPSPMPNIRSNLKHVQFLCKIPSNILENILNSSLKINRIELHSENLHFLLKPVNRLSLLKKLNISPNKKNIDSMELIANEPQETWHLQELNLNLIDLAHEPHLWARAAEVISKILEAVSASCRNFVWHQVEVRYLQGLIQIPQMSKVKQLTLKSYSRYSSKISRFRPTKIFPVGVSLKDKFPNLIVLRIVVFNDCVYSHISHLFDNVEEVVTSVRRIYSNLFQNKKLQDSFAEMFPNASLHHWDGEEDD